MKENLEDFYLPEDDEIVEVAIKVRGSEIWRKYDRRMFVEADTERLGEVLKDMYATASEEVKF